MPPPKQPAAQNLHGEQWLDITDFSPGCFSHDNTTSATLDRLLPAGQGAADAAGTFSCLCLPNGGLAALPAVSQVQTFGGSYGADQTNYIVGFLVHDELANGDTECFVIVEWDNGSNHFWNVYSFTIEEDSWNIIGNTEEASAAGIFGSPYPQMTRVALTNPTTTVGLPVIVFPNGGPSSNTDGATGQVWVYPNPNAPSDYGMLGLITESDDEYSSVSGQLIVHQSRILVFSGVNYQYPAGGGFDTNEQINYTDPPNSVDYGFQQTVLAAEEPYGYGCAGSQSAGELFVVKKRGGGLIVSGDIFDPDVTFLPGVQPTGGIYGQGASTPSGFFYCSMNNGAWVWNGSNTSEKISTQLDDNFFLPPEYYGGIASGNYAFFIQPIGDKVYFCNNWMYDSRSNSWWKYYPDDSQGGTNFYYVNPVSGRYIYAGVLSFDSTDSADFMWQFDTQSPAQHWQWRSLPLHLAGQDRVIDIREIVVRASAASGNNYVSAAVIDGGTNVFSAESATTVGLGPDLIRFNVAALGVREPQIQLNVDGDGSGDSAVIHSVHIKYRVRAHQETTN